MNKPKKSKAGAKPEVKSIIKTQASKEYREIESQMKDRMSDWTNAVAKIRGETPDSVQNEISAFVINSLRKTDDLPTMAKINLATLEMKEQIKLQTKYKLYNNRYEKCLSKGDDEGAELALMSLQDLMTNTDDDYKKFKAINETAKLLHTMKDKVVTVRTTQQDDNEMFNTGEIIDVEEEE